MKSIFFTTYSTKRRKIPPYPLPKRMLSKLKHPIPHLVVFLTKPNITAYQQYKIRLNFVYNYVITSLLGWVNIGFLGKVFDRNS